VENDGSYNNVVHILRNGAPLEVFLLGNPTSNSEGLWNIGVYLTDTWRASNRLSLNLGIRFDRYQNFLSAQRHVADRFFPETVEFPEVGNVRLWNLPAPRLGVSYDLSGDGQTVLKANWGWFWHNPGTSSSNPNGNWFKRHAWSDTNGNKLWDSGEEGRLIASAGGVASTTLDPDQKDPYTLDMSVWVEHELVKNLGIRGGYVHRRQKQPEATINLNQPYEAFNVPVTIIDPGPDGIRGNADDGAPFQAMNLAAPYVGLPSANFVTNVDGESTYDTYEVTMTKRMSQGWMAQVSYSWTKSWAYRTPSNTYPYNPNSCINANADCQDETTDYSFKVNGQFEVGYDFKVSPVFRFQAGNNYGRQFIASGLNYANPTINAEPLGTQRGRDFRLIDLRVDRTFDLRKTRLTPFADVYNLLNANPEQDFTITSGVNYLRPINIVPPRVVRVGVKFDW
jgi:outer membrane receptor protein involved in Fe transport